MTVLAMARDKRRRSRSRDALASAQNEHLGAARVVATAATVVARATDLRDQAKQLHTKAAAAASEAREHHKVAMLAAATNGSAVATAASSREIRHAAADAVDDVEAASAALIAAEATHAEAEGSLISVKRRALQAVDIVLAEELAPHLGNVEAAIEALFRRCEPLAFLLTLRGIDQSVAMRARNLVENVRQLKVNTSGRHVLWPAVTRWEAARDELLSDPDAPLPEHQ